VVVFVAVLPRGGRSLFRSEGVDRRAEDARVRDSALALVRVYVSLTAAGVALLMAMGLGPFDAVAHAFTCVSTGGFSTRGASIGHFGSVRVEIVCIFLMIAGGSNFALWIALWRQGPREAVSKALTSSELRFYLVLIGSLVLFVALVLWFWGGSNGRPDTALPDYTRFLRCLRDSAFSVVTLQTTTGLATAAVRDLARPGGRRDRAPDAVQPAVRLRLGARPRRLLAQPRDELADQDPGHHQHREREEVLEVRDRERVQRLREEEVEARDRQHRGRDRRTAAGVEGDRRDRDEEHQERVRLADPDRAEAQADQERRTEREDHRGGRTEHAPGGATRKGRWVRRDAHGGRGALSPHHDSRRSAVSRPRSRRRPSLGCRMNGRA
jgi:hypothetical protein